LTLVFNFSHCQVSIVVPSKRKQKRPSGRNRARRPRTGENKRLAIRVSEEEKAKIERAAAKAGLSMGRFIVERILGEADRVLSESK
jgi:predicted HicB family RNase H-like nuclease